MTVSQLVITAFAVALVGLALLVVLLHRQLSALRPEVERLRMLGREVEDLRAAVRAAEARPALSVEALPVPAEEPQPVNGIADTSEDDEVRVITRIDTNDADVDLTTSRIASVTLGGPLIKVAALSHGVVHALREEQRMKIAYTFRKELRRQRKMRRRRRVQQGPS